MKRTILALFAITCLLITNGRLAAQEKPLGNPAFPQTGKDVRSPGLAGPNRIRDLTGTWQLARDPANEGKRLNWQKNPPAGDALPAPVPGIIQQVFPDYHGVAWYWTTFHAPAKPTAGTFHALRFLEVDYFAEVWLNGVRLGSHEGAEFAFELRCDDALRHDAENLLVVRVINPIEEPIDGFVMEDIAHRFKFNKNYCPGTMFNYGGITQGVELVENNPVRTIDVHAQADMDASVIKLTIKTRNDLKNPVQGRLSATVKLRDSDQVLVREEMAITASGGDSAHSLSLPIDQPRWWSPEDPKFYNVAVDIEWGGEGAPCRDQQMVRCGFRELKVENGYFNLNGKRILLRATGTRNDYIAGDKISSDHLRRDLIYLKAAGFNTIRFAFGNVYPEQLALCDEIGLMVWDSSSGGWYLSDPRLKTKYSDLSRMPERYDNSMLGIVARDRNHPSVVIWEMMNETYDGPVFRHAYNSLGKLRALDDSRLVILNSGRWDGIISVGSVSNPRSLAWEPVWGKETAGGLPEAGTDAQGKREITFVQAGDALGRAEQMVFGDFHKYAIAPYTKKDRDILRTHASDAKPVFLSENGVGSMLDVINDLRQYAHADPQVKSFNAGLLRQQVDLLLADWDRWGMSDVYPFPEDMFVDSYRQQVRQQRLGFDLVRSNPKICAYAPMAVADWNAADGFWTSRRELKPGMLDTLREGWAPLRWCLFVEPGHVYSGREFVLDAVLANEDVLKPGTYPARLKIFGPAGTVWEKKVDFSVPQPARGDYAPLTVNVLRESVKLDLPPGTYEFAASLEQGGAPVGGRRTFYVSEVPSLPANGSVALLGIEPKVAEWLKSHGVGCRQFDAAGQNAPEVILVGDLSQTGTSLKTWRELLERAARGSTIAFLSPAAFKRGEDPTGWLPLVNKGRGYQFLDWIYHKECVAKAHPVFAGLQGKGVMNWEYYDQLIPHYIFEGQDTPDDIAAVSFATGYQNGGSLEAFPLGYASGLLFAGYRFEQGRFFINTFPMLENLDANPAADRMLLNVIQYAQSQTARTLKPLPADLEQRFQRIGYR